MSEASLASQWVEWEVRSTLEAELRTGNGVLLPINIDHASVTSDSTWAAEIRRDRFIGDFSDWRSEPNYVKSLQRLLSALREPDHPDNL